MRDRISRRRPYSGEFSRNDVVANLGVILAGLLVHLTDSRWPDLIVGAGIALVVIRGGLEILAEANRDEIASLGPERTMPRG